MKTLPLQYIARRDRRGFTLIELMAAATVLGLVTVMSVSLISGVSTTADRAQRRMDTDAAARAALERIGMDFEKMLKRADVDYGFHKNTGNDSLCFYAASQSYGTVNRVISVVDYQITPQHRLTRGVKTIAGTDWKIPIFVSAVPQRLDCESFDNSPLTFPDDYQGLGDGVIRLEFAYLVKAADGVKIDTVAPSQYSELRGLVIAVAVLDGKSRALLSTGELDSIVNSLGDAQVDQAILPIWENVLRGPMGNGKVATAVSNLRFYQRFYFFQ